MCYVSFCRVDSTGIPHILEHSVLCGSRKYPLKEPFVELLKGSLQTFLNAFTYPDRTCYPVASTNLQVSSWFLTFWYSTLFEAVWVFGVYSLFLGLKYENVSTSVVCKFANSSDRSPGPLYH